MTESACAARPWLKHYDYWVPATMNFPRRSLYHLLMTAASYFGERPATLFRDRQLTFWQIKQRADRLAAKLASLGITKGDRVGVMLPNCPQYPISFYAIVRLGAVVTNINPTYTPRETERVAQDSGLRAIVTLEALAPMIRRLQPATSIEHILTTSLEEPDPFADLLAGFERPQLPRVEVDEDDLAALQYTGGTTGPSKGAMLTHHCLFANALQTAVWNQHLIRRGQERILLVLPCFHVYGMMVGVLQSCWNGAQTILMPKYDVDELVDSIRRHRPTFLPGVPTLFISLLHHPEVERCGLERVHGFNSGAAPIPVEVIERFERLSGGMLREGYGLTEVSCTASSTPYLARRKPGSVGLPVTATEFRITDLETGQTEVPLGAEGEIAIRGPQLMKGYWNQPQETANALRDGWLYTGDIGRMDQDGYFYIVQRKKDMINVGGFKVFPNEVEEVLFTHPAVMEAAAIGVPHQYRGEVVKAFVVLKPGSHAGAEELIGFCLERLAKYKVPAEIEFRPSLPKSTVGKVLRRELRSQT